MDNTREAEIQNFIENPKALVTLCETVLNELLASVNDTELREKKAQLSEVSRSIKKLEKLSIGIPDELRNLKISLLTEVETQIKVKSLGEEILVGLKETIRIVETAYFPKATKTKRTRNRYLKSDLPRTKQADFRAEIIEALKTLGGSGTNNEVVEIIEKRMEDKFLAGDFEKQSKGTLVWKNKVRWERNSMKNEGILRDDSPRGIWELSEEYK